MFSTLVIARRELRSYFDSPVAYIVIVSFLLLTGWLFFSNLFVVGRTEMRLVFFPAAVSPATLLIILSPAVTMRLIAEERKTGTLELLSTWPVTSSQIILGKFLAAWALVAVSLLPVFVYAMSVSLLGPLDWGPVFCGYLGMLLFSGALLSIGLLCSTWAQQQIAAFVVAFVVGAALYFVYWLTFYVPHPFHILAEYISLSFHLQHLSRGVIDTRDVLYYVSIVAAGLFLAVHRLDEPN